MAHACRNNTDVESDLRSLDKHPPRLKTLIHDIIYRAIQKKEILIGPDSEGFDPEVYSKASLANRGDLRQAWCVALNVFTSSSWPYSAARREMSKIMGSVSIFLYVSSRISRGRVAKVTPWFEEAIFGSP